MICVYTTPSKKQWRKVFAAGVENFGDDVGMITHFRKHRRHMRRADCLITAGMSSGAFHPENHHKGLVIAEAKKMKMPIVYIDGGIFSDRSTYNPFVDKKLDRNQRPPGNLYYSVMIDFPKRAGIGYLNDIELDPTKWDRIKETINWLDLPPREKQNNATILMHNHVGYALETKNVATQKREYEKVKAALLKHGYTIKTSHHPLGVKRGGQVPLSLEQVLSTSDICVGWHTNALCWPLVYDIPIVCYEPQNYGYELASHDLTKIKIVTKEEKDSWLLKISNCQFNTQEIEDGLFLEKLQGVLNL